MLNETLAYKVILKNLWIYVPLYRTFDCIATRIYILQYTMKEFYWCACRFLGVSFLIFSSLLYVGWIVVCWVWWHDQQTSPANPQGHGRRQTPADDRLLCHLALIRRQENGRKWRWRNPPPKNKVPVHSLLGDVNGRFNN